MISHGPIPVGAGRSDTVTALKLSAVEAIGAR